MNESKESLNVYVQLISNASEILLKG
jgi:hypothetical protein